MGKSGNMENGSADSKAPVASEVLKQEMSKVSLKPTEPIVKGVLPTKEDIQTERQVHDVLRGVEGFNKDGLHHTSTEERTILPSADDLKTERVHHSLIQGIEHFDKNKLEHAETKEPKLPSAIGNFVGGKYVNVSYVSKSGASWWETYPEGQAYFRSFAPHIIDEYSRTAARANATFLYQINIEVERYANLPAPNLSEVPKVGPDFKKELDQVKLHPTQTNVKVRLPSESDLSAERSHHDLISGIEGFNKKQLNHQEPQENNPLPSVDALRTERAHHEIFQGVENFDKNELHHAVPAVKDHLPTANDIQQERASLH